MSYSVLGVDFQSRDLSVPFLILNMIGGGLSWFMAITWSNVFQSALDDYKEKQQKRGVITNVVWLNLLLAVIATLFSMAILYLMIKTYQHVQSKFKIQL
jgi:hypothetical protein